MQRLWEEFLKVIQQQQVILEVHVGQWRGQRDGRAVLVLLLETPVLMPRCLCFVLGH